MTSSRDTCSWKLRQKESGGQARQKSCQGSPKKKPAANYRAGGVSSSTTFGESQEAASPESSPAKRPRVSNSFQSQKAALHGAVQASRGSTSETFKSASVPTLENHTNDTLLHEGLLRYRVRGGADKRWKLMHGVLATVKSEGGAVYGRLSLYQPQRRLDNEEGLSSATGASAIFYMSQRPSGYWIRCKVFRATIDSTGVRTDSMLVTSRCRAFGGRRRRAHSVG